ncbi:MAG: long-chain fatty acid--CoA ligase [Propionicimonas sp.]|nr:long-chain fatty acid--CoA ligase [Propionicimonas sp.]
MDATLIAVLDDAVARHGSRNATRIASEGGWATMTFAELDARARGLAARLVDLGVQAGDRVAIFSTNRPEWTIADLACLNAAAISVPLYATSTPPQVKHILSDSGAVVAFVAGRRELAIVEEVWPELPELRKVLVFDELSDAGPRVGGLDEGSDAGRAEVEARRAAVRPQDVTSLVYTSGTTGDPKGAMLTHRGFTHQITVLNSFFDITPDDHSLCFLPLSHALERAWTYVVLANGCMNTYVADPRQVATSLVDARPTLLVSVPRLYEKVYAGAYEKVAGSPAKQRILSWALRVGGHNQRAYRKGRRPSPFWAAQLKLADKLVLGAVRDALGGAKTVMACGGAPLRHEIEEFLSACGLLVLQGYGLTECSPLVSFPSPEAFKFGTVGKVMPGGEVKIAEGGEICYRGPNLMAGYWNRPDATAQAIQDGWLHTGDVGYLDPDDYLVITDRIKDLIITSTGKNIAPAPIEGLVAADPLVEYAVVLGDNRPYLTLLVSPSIPDLEELGRQLRLSWARTDELVSHPEIVDELKRRVQGLTGKLAHYEQIKDLRVLWEEFTQENGLLTPTLKVKRTEVEKRFGHLVEEMYSSLRTLPADVSEKAREAARSALDRLPERGRRD